MTDRTAVVAIGGNALLPEGDPGTIHDQFRHARESLAPIVDFVRAGWKVVIVHGNGPQVGNALLRNECARDRVPELPLGVLVASTAGWIGYMIQQSLENALTRAGESRRVVTVITQVLVDLEAAADGELLKFIGREIDEELAVQLRREGARVARDARGRLRRQVPSPPPIAVVEAPVVAKLASRGTIVVAAGGGGVPVCRDPEGCLEGLDVVVDKDLAAALLAHEIRASVLLILTDVDGVYEGYGTPEARRIERLGVTEARALVAGTELGRGSMRPKVEAAARFVAGGGDRAVIAALQEAAEAARGRAGTVIVADRSGGEAGGGKPPGENREI